MPWRKLAGFRDSSVPKLDNLRRAAVAGLRVPETWWMPASEAEKGAPFPAALAGRPLIVRSGSPTEDTHATSNAGQLLSLAVRDPMGFPNALARVVAAMPREGVVFVQPLIQAEEAGVAFFDGFYYERTLASGGNEEPDLGPGAGRGDARPSGAGRSLVGLAGRRPPSLPPAVAPDRSRIRQGRSGLRPPAGAAGALPGRPQRDALPGEPQGDPGGPAQPVDRLGRLRGGPRSPLVLRGGGLRGGPMGGGLFRGSGRAALDELLLLLPPDGPLGVAAVVRYRRDRRRGRRAGGPPADLRKVRPQRAAARPSPVFEPFHHRQGGPRIGPPRSSDRLGVGSPGSVPRQRRSPGPGDPHQLRHQRRPLGSLPRAAISWGSGERAG